MKRFMLFTAATLALLCCGMPGNANNDGPDAKEAVDAVLKGWFNDAPAYTLQSLYDSAPKF